MLYRTTLLVLLTLTVGCYASNSRQTLVSQLPRDDGSMLRVECVSNVKHTISSVSSTLEPRPQVTVIMDERTFWFTPPASCSKISRTRLWEMM